MEKEGVVSLWLGNFGEEEELEFILTVPYTDDGDFIPSTFAKLFEIERYDDAVREAEYYEECTHDLLHLLEGFSYDEIIIPRFAELLKNRHSQDYNAAILLYNFEYTGNIQETEWQSKPIHFFGAVEYL